MSQIQLANMVLYGRIRDLDDNHNTADLNWDVRKWCPCLSIGFENVDTEMFAAIGVC